MSENNIPDASTGADLGTPAAGPQGSYPVPSQPPMYSSRPYRPNVNRRRIYAMLDSAFAIYGLLLSFWMVALLAWQGISFSWQGALYLVIFWFFLTYLALPRMHQIFTTWYLPDYFVARTKTGDGLLGDPVNLALLGSENDVHAAMRRAGWTQADPITMRSSLGIVRSSITGTSYPAAPVSDLFLFGRRHDFAYQQEVDGNAAQRHHVRFWRVPDDWCLPGGKRVDWLAAGTYDRCVGLSEMTLQITHKIDADVDAERDYIINTVRYEDAQCPVSVIENFSTPFFDENGGGDTVMTDGNMPILDVNGAFERAQSGGVDLVQQDTLPETSVALLEQEIPPKQFTLVALFLIFELLVSGLVIALSDVWLDKDGMFTPDFSLGLGGFIVCVFLLILLFLSWRKKAWPQLIFLVLASITATSELITLSVAQQASFGAYIEGIVSLLLVLAFSAPAVRYWVHARPRRGGNLTLTDAKANSTPQPPALDTYQC